MKEEQVRQFNEFLAKQFSVANQLASLHSQLLIKDPVREEYNKGFRDAVLGIWKQYKALLDESTPVEK